MTTEFSDSDTITLTISDMACAGCADTVQAALADVEGVRSASVNLEAKTATVRVDDNRVSAGQLEKAVEAAGYSARRAQ